MIVPAVTLALALIVIAGFALLFWQLGVQLRFGLEQARYELRVQQREELPTDAEMDEAVRVLVRIEAERLGGQLTSDRFLRDSERAHGLLADALAGSSAELRVVT